MKSLPTCCLIALLIGLWSSLPTGLLTAAVALQEPAAPAQQAPALDTLLAQFRELDGKLAAKQTEYEAATDDNLKSDLRTEYLQLLNQQEVQIGLIRKSAVEALKANPGDTNLQKTLLGVLMHEAQAGRDTEVLEAGDALVTAGVNPKMLELAAGAERLSLTARELLEELLIRQRDAAANLPRVKLTTSKGVIELELFEDQAPNTVANFLELVGSKFYDGVKFHRVLDGFMAQSGDPKGDGTGGPGYTIACECRTPEARRHFTGSLSMAKQTAPDTGGSQFFLVFDRSESIQRLDGKHTVFGRVIAGQDVLNSLTRTHESTLTGEQQIAGVTPDTIISAEVVRKRDHEYKVKKVGDVSAETPAPTPPPANPPAGGTGGRP